MGQSRFRPRRSKALLSAKKSEAQALGRFVSPTFAYSSPLNSSPGPSISVGGSRYLSVAAVALGSASLHVWDTLKFSLALTLTNLGQHLNGMISYYYNDEHNLVLAVDRRVVMISIPEGRVLCQYEHISDEIKSVFAFCSRDGNPCFWIGTHDNQLLCLDSELKPISSFKLSEPVLSLALNQSIDCLAVGMKTHIVIKSMSSVDDDLKFPAHLDGVKQVGWHHSMLLSLGHLDNTISLWSIQAGKGMPKLVASLTCNQPINYFNNKQGIVIAGCGDGTLAVFDIALIGEMQVVGGVMTGPKDALILDPIQVTFARGPESSQSGKVIKIPISTSNIARTDTGLSIATTRGNVLKPEFEVIPLPLEDVVMYRTFNEEQLLFSKSSVKSSNRHTATVIWEREVDFVRGNNLLYDQIRGEDMICDDILLVQTVPNETLSNEEVQSEGLGASILIEQALKSGDKEVLDQALSIKPHLIASTLKSISVSSAFPFLEALVTRFLKCKQGRIPVLAPWYQNLLVIHGDTFRTDLKKYKSMVTPLADMMDEYMKSIDSVEEALVSVEKTLRRIGGGRRLSRH